ncbi:MAG: aminotransferase class V-fold PLP-dependent enzyme [Gammaproteobacteria bacterium]|nr:aminotransferase class V-fold PLP-dependent enzyme [Gammaproteobacteria bacterium]MDH5277087.1 aminotransferase class V-fold PLP-dependent enzyme [Gammaproteobacteria bacterium]
MSPRAAMPPRQILLNPGPVTLTDRVRAALTGGDWCHREAEFATLLQDINRRLVHVHPGMADAFRAVTLAGSGTGAVEAMLATFAPDARSTLVVANGVYGERMARMLEAHGKPFRVVGHAWTDAIDVAAVVRQLDDDPAITHLAVVHHETTTGRLNDLATLGSLCRERQVTLLLDAVSSFGAERIDADAWNVGALAGTANKCLHGVAGLSFVLARDTLWSAPACRSGSVYLDLRAYYGSQHRDGFSPFTLPVQVAFALREALAEHAGEGGSAARRQSYLGRAARIAATLRAAGVTTLLPEDEYSAVLWSWQLPAGQTYARLHAALKVEGFVIYAGQGALGAQIFRIAHMGDIRPDDMDRLCAALTRILGATA